ncbi:MAG: hypothetical protein JWN86_3280 [Planctomycetota bacterium]|nr:hypothetical protein [Planctomycetota bacterium]
MALNHLNMTVTDVAKSREFFVTYFGFRRIADKGPGAFAALVDESKFVLTLNNFDEAAEVHIPAGPTSASSWTVGSRWTRSTSG